MEPSGSTGLFSSSLERCILGRFPHWPLSQLNCSPSGPLTGSLPAPGYPVGSLKCLQSLPCGVKLPHDDSVLQKDRGELLSPHPLLSTLSAQGPLAAISLMGVWPCLVRCSPAGEGSERRPWWRWGRA